MSRLTVDEASSVPTPSHVGPFALKETLGVGNNGKVKLGVHVDTGMKVAVKVIDKRLFSVEPTVRHHLEREIAVMRLVDQPHVLRLYDVYETVHHL